MEETKISMEKIGEVKDRIMNAPKFMLNDAYHLIHKATWTIRIVTNIFC